MYFYSFTWLKIIKKLHRKSHRYHFNRWFHEIKQNLRSLQFWKNGTKWHLSIKTNRNGMNKNKKSAEVANTNKNSMNEQVEACYLKDNEYDK